MSTTVNQNTNGNVYNPDPFYTGLSHSAVPVSKSEKVNASQFVSAGYINTNLLGSTLMVKGTGSTGIDMYLPSSENIYNYMCTARSSPAVGDFLVTKVYNSHTGVVNFNAGTGGSGVKSIGLGLDALLFKLTDVSTGAYAYDLM